MGDDYEEDGIGDEVDERSLFEMYALMPLDPKKIVDESRRARYVAYLENQKTGV